MNPLASTRPVHQRTTPALLVGAVLVLFAVSAHAQNTDARGEDYDIDSQAWNGLTTLAGVAKGLNLKVETVREIDWDDMGPEDILFLVYPRLPLQAGHVAAFIRHGGHVIIADDFGDSAQALARLGILHERGMGVAAERFYRDLQYVPMARPLIEDHPLAKNVTELATNHPAVLREVRGHDLVFGFNSSDGVVAAGDVGSGRFIVVSDPSIFINRMMQFEGNVEFAYNALRYLGRPGQSSRLVVLIGEFTLSGEPSERFDGDSSDTIANMAFDFNDWLAERNDYLLTEPGMRLVAVILAVLVGFLALLALPLSRKSKMDGTWTRGQSSTWEANDFRQVVERYERKNAKNDNYLLPATILRDAVNGALERILGTEDPIGQSTEHDIDVGLTVASSNMAGTAYRRLHKRLKSLPSRVQAASPWSTRFMSRRDFERLYEDAVELYLALGEEPG